MDSFISTIRDRRDARLIMVVWRAEARRFELWWTATDCLDNSNRMIHIVTPNMDQGVVGWKKGKAHAITYARGLAAMNEEQFDRAIRELSVPR